MTYDDYKALCDAQMVIEKKQKPLLHLYQVTTHLATQRFAWKRFCELSDEWIKIDKQIKEAEDSRIEI